MQSGSLTAVATRLEPGDCGAQNHDDARGTVRSMSFNPLAAAVKWTGATEDSGVPGDGELQVKRHETRKRTFVSTRLALQFKLQVVSFSFAGAVCTPTEDSPAFSPHPMDRSPFFKLPAELRNLIWSFSLQSEPDSATTFPDIYKEPSLSRTCHQIRAESLLMYYACQPSMVAVVANSDTKALLKWLYTRRERAQLICRLDVVSNTAVKHELDEGTKTREAWESLVEALKPYNEDGMQVIWHKRYTGGKELMPRIQEILFQSRMKRMIEGSVSDGYEK
ncbi:hypothetical protein CERZMDRAFT_94350 [Cercospora zeae-maydis SCOH1-5]|uniref:Uncharacterized protein n=1 Tax=Cercospora zeae-maydis SCOH1-5 TaxID=717836 RepID=A0A6A6FRQ4_9PEZI|nr:hypothetical protein CERZMDRAFT_94350 [Cercospora zeae-maydis SCOH1-5]